jgi:hypothetical protein
MKTTKQAAQEYAAQERVTRSEYVAFVEGVEFAQRWISVEDELPENSDNEQLLLVKNTNGRIMLCYYYRNNIFWSNAFGKMLNITHWRHIKLK